MARRRKTRNDGEQDQSPPMEPVAETQEEVDGDDEALLLDPKYPVEIAQCFLIQKYMTLDEKPLLRHWRGDWYARDYLGHRRVAEATIVAQLYAFLSEAHQPTKTGTKPFEARKSRVQEIVHALMHDPNVRLPDEIDEPMWLLGPENGRPDAKQLLACRDALVDLSTGRTVDPEGYFTISAASYGFDPGADLPQRWLKFLNEVFEDDVEQIETLQQWFGLVASSNIDFHKILMLIGPKRSGKGTIARVLREMIGPKNTVFKSLQELSRNFGLQDLPGCRLAVLSDERVSARTDQRAMVSNLLKLSGGDPISIDRKHQTPWQGIPRARWLLMSNMLPRLDDPTGTIVDRFVLLKTRQSFLGREDHRLEDALMKELPGILNWAIEGYQELLQQGQFVQPEAGMEDLQFLREQTSTLIAFIEECCTVETHEKVECNRLYDAYCGYCSEMGCGPPPSLYAFGSELKGLYPHIKRLRKRINKDLKYCYVGINLQTEGAKKARKQRLRKPFR